MNSCHKVVRSIRKILEEPRPKKSTSSSIKCEGFAHCFLLLQWYGASWILATSLYAINKENYLEAMQRLREAIHQKRTELWKNQSWILHHDNAPADTLLLVREFLAKNKIVIMPQPPYSPDLALAGFFLFPKLKTPIKEKRFATIETRAVDNTKKKERFRSVSRIGKIAGISAL